MKEVYLDNAATTKVTPKVADKVKQVMTKEYGNPSSLHNKGLAAEKVIKEARENLAHKLQVEAKEIFFTSGGTEANNLAIKGALKTLRNKGNRIITSSIEHPSVLNVFKELEEEWDVKYLEVDHKGSINLDQLEKLLTADTVLVSIMAVNNETGTIQPLKKISNILKSHKNLYWHVDGIQALGKVNILPDKLGINLYSMSAHKIHGPMGVGALYVSSDTRLKSLVQGSSQEEGLRPGTENVPGIAGFGKAIKLLPSKEEIKDMYQLKKDLTTRILTEIDDVFLNGPQIEQGAAHIVNMSVAGLRGEVVVHSLEEEGIYISTGAACSSRQANSHVLEALEVGPDLITGALRFSFSLNNTKEEIDYTVDILKNKVTMLRKYM
ncbi:cysteine desulfurase family protein [Halobacteroides halobius DSM 5150]|uniref:Cysteine desulfurase family protein n=1 Tax=Halobacteroides halobius (strain ATCC 35273 / DSM 5150 / MD-1) TaxID=748449 RepID=L0K7R9_HALHC|nr:cysteine desulfurase family protein [Halobacteroides halobius]AGB41297.1 cysteine desulfurase family protein [Halobacteroides halobius DSM 5150]